MYLSDIKLSNKIIYVYLTGNPCTNIHQWSLNEVFKQQSVINLHLILCCTTNPVLSCINHWTDKK